MPNPVSTCFPQSPPDQQQNTPCSDHIHIHSSGILSSPFEIASHFSTPPSNFRHKYFLLRPSPSYHILSVVRFHRVTIIDCCNICLPLFDDLHTPLPEGLSMDSRLSQGARPSSHTSSSVWISIFWTISRSSWWLLSMDALSSFILANRTDTMNWLSGFTPRYNIILPACVSGIFGSGLGIQYRLNLHLWKLGSLRLSMAMFCQSPTEDNYCTLLLVWEHDLPDKTNGIIHHK